jgi:uncharacterized repeat protein (TIGR02543 family)
MKNKRRLLAMPGKAALLAALVFGFGFAGCDNPAADNGGNGNDAGTHYTVTYTVGYGGGSAPASQTVTGGSSVTLPYQGNMTAPSGQVFDGWLAGSTIYQGGSSYRVNGNVTFTAQWRTPGTTGGGALEEGVYIGLLSFDQTTHMLTSQPVLLDNAGKITLQNAMDGYQKDTEGGTVLYYSVHKALNTMKGLESRLPTNAKSFNIITFTDGVDVGSANPILWQQSPLDGQNFAGDNPAYLTWLSSQLATTTIKGFPVVASAYGAPGEDVADTATFTSNLSKLTTPSGEVNTSIPFDQLSAKFGEIAASLDVTTTTTAFNMLITPNSNGDKYKMTFDNIGSDPAVDLPTSNTYFVGTYNYSNGAYTISNIEYHGITCPATSVTGAVAGNKVKFVFDNFSLNSGPINKDYIRQWIMDAGTSGYHHNQEYDKQGTTDSQTTKSTAVIYLVLDSSKSLSDDQPDVIKNAALNFIDVLYDKYYGGTPPVSTTYTVTFNASGGYPAPSSRTVTAGSALGSLPSEPALAGYTFGGWFTQQNGGGTQYTASYPAVNGNVTLYAYWISSGGGGLSYEVQAFKEDILAMYSAYPDEFSWFLYEHGLSAYPDNPYSWTDAQWKSVYTMVVGGEDPFH